MTLISLSKLAVLLPLIAALAVATAKGNKARKAPTLGPDEKEILRDCWKSVAYILALGILIMWLVPPLGVVGCFFGILFTAIFAALTILCVLELDSPHLTKVHDLLWTDWRKTPGYSKTGHPVEYVRWGRRFATVPVLLFVCFAALLGGQSNTASATAQGGSQTVTAGPSTPATTPTAAPSTAVTTAPATSVPTAVPATALPTSDGASAPAFIDNTCTPGPKQIPMVDSPSTIPFKTASHMWICNSGSWKTWSDAFPLSTPPANITLVAWVVSGSYGYGHGSDPATGDSYTFRTDDFH